MVGRQTHLRLDVDGKRGTAGTKAHESGRKRPGEVNEVLGIDCHDVCLLLMCGGRFGDIHRDLRGWQDRHCEN